MAENRQIDRRQFLAALVAGGAGGMFAMGSGSTGPAGSSATVGPGTSPRIPKWISANNIGDSIIQDDGTAIKPLSDNASDLGTSSLRYRTGYIPIIDGGANDVQVNPNVGFVPTIDAAKDLGRAGNRWRDFRMSRNGQIDTSLGIGIGASGTVGQLDVNKRILVGGDADNTPIINWLKASDRSNLLQIYHDGSNASIQAKVGAFQLISDNSHVTVTIPSGFALRPSTDATRNLGGSSLRWDSGFIRTINSGSSDLTLTPNAATVPGSDAAKDLGTSGLRWRDLRLSRRVIIAGKNALVLDGQSMTQSSHTVSNADTDIATYSLGANSYTRVIVRVTGYVSFVVLSTNQSVNLKILDGTTQVGNTMVVDGALSANASIPFTLEAAFVETSAVTIHLTEGAAAADANTTVFINSIIVLAES